MKRSTSGILLVGGLFGLLVLINFLFFVETQPNNENEENGNRSSYRSTPYGTLAFYTLLEESGYKVTRLQTPYTRLKDRPDIRALVIIAPPPVRNPTVEEIEALTTWIQAGGVVVIIDREIQLTLDKTEIRTDWRGPMENLRALQPTRFTRGVQRVEVSSQATQVTLDSPTAVYHFGNEESVLLADAELDKGRIVLMTDPYVIANNGIGQADNAVLGLNLFAAWTSGTIAFDEFHHGYGASQGEGLMAYFNGTPVPWMMAQAGLLGMFVIYTYGRRFARPLPLKVERRTTNLEFVSGMANITRLARATDVAMQNIYAEFRKRLCRYSGLPSKCESSQLASIAARRAGLNETALLGLLKKCDEVAHGRVATDRELLDLVTQIREIESQLKL